MCSADTTTGGPRRRDVSWLLFAPSRRSRQRSWPPLPGFHIIPGLCPVAALWPWPRPSTRSSTARRLPCGKPERVFWSLNRKIWSWSHYVISTGKAIFNERFFREGCGPGSVGLRPTHKMYVVKFKGTVFPRRVWTEPERSASISTTELIEQDENLPRRPTERIRTRPGRRVVFRAGVPATPWRRRRRGRRRRRCQCCSSSGTFGWSMDSRLRALRERRENNSTADERSSRLGHSPYPPKLTATGHLSDYSSGLQAALQIHGCAHPQDI